MCKGDDMDSELLSSFLATLKQVNDTMTDLVAASAKHDIMLKFLISVFLLEMAAAFGWGFKILFELVKKAGGVG